MKFLREIWMDYRSEIIFGIVLGILVVFSYWAAAFIPEDVFEMFINPVQYVATTTVCLFGAWLMFRHHDGNIMRKSWGYTLLIWAAIDLMALISRYAYGITAIGGTPDDPLFNSSLILGNLLAWLLFIYPSQVLRPGWLNWWKVFIIVMPMVIIGVIDYFVPANLIYIIMTYPVVIFFLLCRHIRKYRRWCEDHFSSMDNIDVQWVVRYLIILALLGLSYYFIAFWYVPNRMFTQQWMLFLILTYSTEQILFRRDPWEEVLKADEQFEREQPAVPVELSESTQLFEQWMNDKKPYLNPNFQLNDLRAVLPINRTYLSQFVNSNYGCSFYQLVNHYRVEDAKRILIENPKIRISEVASSCGYSSSTVFTRAFVQETGMPPREWLSRQ